MDRITMTPGQMVALGKLVTGLDLLIEPHEPDQDGRWTIEQTADGDLRVRDVERDFYLSPGGGIR